MAPDPAPSPGRGTQLAASTSTTWLLWLSAALVVLYCASLAAGLGVSPAVNVMSVLTQIVPVAIFWIVANRTRFARREVTLAAIGVTLSAIADVTYTLSMGPRAALPFPSPVDAGYLLFYPFMLAALWALVRRQARVAIRTMMLDSVVAALGAAAVLAAILGSIIDAAFTGPSWFDDAIAVAYPALDMALIAAIAGIAASPNLDIGPRWTFLISGIAIMMGTDIVFALQENAGTYVAGTVLDGGWALGLALLAWWVDGFGRPDHASRRREKLFSLSLPALAVLAGLCVLLVGTQVDVSIVSLALAGTTVGLAAVPLMFRQAVLRRETRTDPLTGLLNRRAFGTDAPARLVRGKGRDRSALILLDLDKFKEVNDTMGHEVGDALLVEVSSRLTGTLRSGDILARLGGDEFAILLEDAGEAEAVEVASKIRAALTAPLVVGGLTLHSSASMGIALYPGQGTDLRGLLRRADMAMYKAKATRDGHHVFRRGDDPHGETRLHTLQQLRVALREDQLVVHYQPIADLATGNVTGVEALVRWNHPTRGLLPPESFIRLAEESALMAELTGVVLVQTLDQAARWSAAGRPLSVSVNLSAGALANAELPGCIAGLLEERGLPASGLVLEITEEFLMADMARSAGILAQLRAIGVQIAVDDFGTGYSSLSYLRELPIDEVKLDRSFVVPMDEDPRARALVASTVDLAHSLGLRMVAEGVESAAAWDALAGYGCDLGQGFFISRPLAAENFDRWLAERVVDSGAGAHAPEERHAR